MSERQFWTYYITRNSENGIPDAEFDVWWLHPLRIDHGCCVTWEPTDQNNPGWYQKYTREQLEADHMTIPDDDHQLIIAERWAYAETPKMPRKRPMDSFK